MQNSAELEFGLNGVLMRTIPPQGTTRTPRGFGIDPEQSVAATRVPAASKEESCLQVILRLLCPIDRRAHNGHYSGLWSTGLDFL